MRRRLSVSTIAAIAVLAVLGTSGALSQIVGGPSPAHETAGSRGPVDVGRLSRQAPTKRPTGTLPDLGRGVSTGRTSPRDGQAPRVVSPPAPTLATLNANGPAAQTGFDGLARSSTASTIGEPPDPWLAVGPDHVVQVVNTALRITDRQGGDPLDVSLPDFFQLPLIPETFDSDPRVIYDSLHGRWLAAELSWDCRTSATSTFGTGYIDFAVSRTSDPTGIWDSYYRQQPDYLLDFPAVGTSTDKVGIAFNQYHMAAGASCVENATPAGIPGGRMIMDWTDLTNGSGVVVAYDGLDGFSPRFAVQSPATSSRLHLIMEMPDLGVAYLSYVGSVVGSTLGTERSDLLTTAGVVAAFVEPPPPNQPGPDIVTTAIDSRPTDAIWQNDRLVFVSTQACTPTGDSTIRDCVRVTELSTTAVSATVKPTLKQDFLIAENGVDSWMGGIGLSGNGALHVVWTRSSTAAGDFPSSYGAYQLPTDVANAISPKELLKAGTGTYSGDRWGDYVGVAQDPFVPSAVWQGNQYSGGASEWKTWISRLQTEGTTYVPITPLRVLDTRVPTGLSGMFTANSARTWQVAGVGTIPAGAVAVTGNVTVTGQQAAGYVSVTPTAIDTPPSSSINFPLGDNRANNLTVPLSATGSLSAVYKAVTGKKTQLIFDVTGYFLADDSGATFTPLTPVRVLDTRNGTGLAGAFVNGRPRMLSIADTPGIPATATAITGNLTVTRQSARGFIAVTRTPTVTPETSTLNFPVGDNRANGLFAPLDDAGRLSIVYKSGSAGATTHVILDVTGYFEPGIGGLRFVPLNPGRIMDTRSSAVLSGLSGLFSANTARILPIDGHWGVPIGAAALTGNLTVTGQTGAGYVSVSPGAPPVPPATSTLNFPLGDNRANGLVAPLNGSGDTYLVYVSGSGKKTNLILDLSGYFE